MIEICIPVGKPSRKPTEMLSANAQPYPSPHSFLLVPATRNMCRCGDWMVWRCGYVCSIYYCYSSCGGYGKSCWAGCGKWIAQTGGEKKKYWLSWELNPDHLPSACNQQDLLGRRLTIRPLCLVDVPKCSACSCASFSVFLT